MTTAAKNDGYLGAAVADGQSDPAGDSSSSGSEVTAGGIGEEDLVVLNLENEGRDHLWEKTREALIHCFENYYK